MIGTLAQSIDVPAEVRTALVVFTSEAGSPALLARVNSATLEAAVAGPMLILDRTYGSSAQELYLDDAGNQLTLLPSGVLVVGTAMAVESIIDIAEASSTSEASPVIPCVGQLVGDSDSDIGFVYALPAMFDDAMATGSTLVAAEAVVGSFDIAVGSINGSLAFHMANGVGFIDAFNALNRASTEGGTETPLTIADPAVDGLKQVVAVVQRLPLDANADDVAASLAFFTKLFVGNGRARLRQRCGRSVQPGLARLRGQE